MRCLILAIDSLEYEIAKNFPNLKQKEFGKVIVPLTHDGEPYTPVVWGSFISGLSPSENKIYEEPVLKWENPVLQRIREFLGKRRSMPHLKNHVGKVLVSLGFKMTTEGIFHTMADFKEKNISTIFDFAKKPIAISVPSYNEDPINQYLRRRIYDVYQNGLAEEVLEKEILEIFYDQAERNFEKLDEEWDLFMVHFYAVDVFSHLYPNNNSKFYKLYAELDNMVKKIKNKVNDSFIFVVSDHGHRNGLHTSYGFYSTNEILGLHYPKITDFYQIILRILSN